LQNFRENINTNFDKIWKKQILKNKILSTYKHVITLSNALPPLLSNVIIGLPSPPKVITLFVNGPLTEIFFDCWKNIILDVTFTHVCEQKVKSQIFLWIFVFFENYVTHIRKNITFDTSLDDFTDSATVWGLVKIIRLGFSSFVKLFNSSSDAPSSSVKTTPVNYSSE
jgi:hypothetical protein